MLKSYVVFEKGLVETLIFYLKNCLTFGRSPENDIQTSDTETSDFHAEIRLEDGRAVVEDLGSQVGTFLNGEKTRKAILSHNDQVQIGDMVFRFIQEEVFPALSETAPDARSTGGPAGYRQKGTESLRSSSRVAEAVSNIPLFSGLDPESMSEIIQQARLLVFDADQMVFHQGDPGKSLFIVLDGSVRVFIPGRKGESVPLAVLSENQFFGEISFLTGQPRSANVQAMENTLLCEVGADTLREITYRWPAIKNTLNRYYQQRVADTAEKKRKAGIRELRGAPRYNITVPVSFTLDATAV
ncbi:MAG: cyclic nucleotide-binding domain-containing protein, partial [Eubacteriales bacterium]|nr:cyclic nucleotide-binding domain-containing protein [Eubacteriales bacterium]